MPTAKSAASPSKRGRDSDDSSDEGGKKFPDLVLQWKDDDDCWYDFGEEDEAILVKAAATYFKGDGSSGTEKFTTKAMSFSTDNAVTFNFSTWIQLNEDTKKKRSFRALQGKGVWEYTGDSGGWVAFYDEDNEVIEAAWRKLPTGSGKYKTKDLSWNKGHDSMYTFTFTEDSSKPANPQAVQKNEDSGNERTIRRVEPKGTGVWDLSSYGIAKLKAPTKEDAIKVKVAIDEAAGDSGAAEGPSSTTGGEGALAIDLSMLDPPSYWEKQTKPMEMFTLDEDSSEYKEVLKPFEKTLGNLHLTVHSIKRIQNETLWKFYALTRFKVACRNAGNPNEKSKLFHGARVRANMDAIINFGFDYKVACEYGSCGAGIYFAENSCYSNGGYVLQNKDGSKEMFVCRVACGSGTQGASGMKRPPSKKPGKVAAAVTGAKKAVKKAFGYSAPTYDEAPAEDLYDSVHQPGGDPKGPKTMHVVFDNTQAIPEYLIHYTVNWKAPAKKVAAKKVAPAKKAAPKKKGK